MIDRAIKKLGIDEFIIDGNPTNEEEFLSMFKKVVGVDEEGLGILSSDPADFGVTWTQIQDELPAAIQEVNLEILRFERNIRLADSDWSQNNDVPDDVKQKWQPYRQALRDITEHYSSLDDVVWPDKPE